VYRTCPRHMFSNQAALGIGRAEYLNGAALPAGTTEPSGSTIFRLAPSPAGFVVNAAHPAGPLTTGPLGSRTMHAERVLLVWQMLPLLVQMHSDPHTGGLVCVVW
jgi:hypothetical protein